MLKLQKPDAKKTASPEYREIAGGKLFIELWPAKGCPLLFYPGTMIEPAHYHLLTGFLSAAGFTVCALHLPGHGKNPTKLTTFTDCLNLGLEAAHWLKKKFSMPPVICGHSQGGIFALAHAAESAEPGACFAISAALPQLPDAIKITRFGRLASFRDKILNITEKIASLAPNFPVPLPVYLSARRILAGREKPVLVGKGRSRISYPARFLHSLFSLETKLPLKTACMLFSARDDALFSPDVIRQTYQLAKPPEGKIVWLPRGGHMAIFNPQLAQFVANTCAAYAASLNLELKLEQLNYKIA